MSASFRKAWRSKIQICATALGIHNRGALTLNAMGLILQTQESHKEILKYAPRDKRQNANCDK